MDAKTRAIFREILREIGAKGGKVGGKRSLETMTPEQRSARAAMAAAHKQTAESWRGNADQSEPRTAGFPKTSLQLPQ
jgi:hypothetical protein